MSAVPATSRPGIGAAVVLLVAGLAASAQEAPAPAAEVSYHRDVVPLLQARCQGCHQPARPSGDVVLTSHAALLAELDGLPLVAAGDPAGSLLLDSVTPLGDVPPAMPKDAPPLTAAERALLVAWIRAGAIDDTPPGGQHVPTPDDPPTYPVAPIVTALAFSPDGTWLAVSGRHEVLLHAIDPSTGGLVPDAPVRRLVGLSPRIEALAFAPPVEAEPLLAVAGGAPGRFGELQLWRPSDATLVRSLAVTFDTLAGIDWSPDGALVAVGAKDSTLRAFDAASGEQVLFQGAHDDWVQGTTFSTDGSHLISVGRDRSAKLTKVATEQFIDNITSITPGALTGGLLAVERHPLRDEVLVGGADGEPKLYRVYREKKREIGDDYNRLRSYEPFVGRVTGVAFSPDGEGVYACASLSALAEPARGGALRAYGPDGATRWTRTFDGALYALAVHPGGATVAAAGYDGAVHLLAAADGTTVRDFVPVPLEPAPDAASSPVAPATAAEPTDAPAPPQPDATPTSGDATPTPLPTRAP